MNYNSIPDDPFLEEQFSCFFHLFRRLPEWPGYGVDTDGYLWGCRAPGTSLEKFKNKWTRLKYNPTSSNGRIIVGLNHNRKKTSKQLHRLIMEVFIGPCPVGMEVCHNNGDHTNNRLYNLRYGTRKENAADQIKHATRLRGDRHPIAKLNVDKVRQIKILLREGKENITQIAKRFKVDKSIICRIRDKKAWYWVE